MIHHAKKYTFEVSKQKVTMPVLPEDWPLVVKVVLEGHPNDGDIYLFGCYSKDTTEAIRKSMVIPGSIWVVNSRGTAGWWFEEDLQVLFDARERR